jgi:hypothetical protein
MSRLRQSSAGTPELRSGPRQLQAVSVGALAVGAAAVGATAVGALAIARLVIGRAVIRRLKIEELEVRRLHVHELQVDEQPAAVQAGTRKGQRAGYAWDDHGCAVSELHRLPRSNGGAALSSNGL